MTANINDKFTSTFTTDLPTPTTVTATRASGGTTLTCNSLDWPTDTAVHFTTYQKNADGTSKSVYGYKGIVNGNTITNVTKQFSAADPGNAIGDFVVMRPSGDWAQDITNGILVSHNQDGTLKDNVVTTTKIADSAITTSKIGSAQVTSDKIDLASLLATLIKTYTVPTSYSMPSQSNQNLGAIIPVGYVPVSAANMPAALSWNDVGGQTIYFRNNSNTTQNVTANTIVFTFIRVA